MIWFLFFILGIANQTEIYSGPIRKTFEYKTADGKRVGIQEWSDK